MDSVDPYAKIDWNIPDQSLSDPPSPPEEDASTELPECDLFFPNDDACEITFPIISPYLESLMKKLAPFSHDLFKYSICLLQECVDPTHQTEEMVSELGMAIEDTVEFSRTDSDAFNPFDFVYKDALALLKSEILRLLGKSDTETLVLFEEWLMSQLCIAVTSIKFAYLVKEHYNPHYLQKSLDYLLELLGSVPTNISMKHALKSLQKEAKEYSLHFASLPLKVTEDAPLSRLPSPSLPCPSWIIQDDTTSTEALAHRQSALDAFCNQQKHPVVRLKNLFVYLSYPIPLSHTEWELIESQCFPWNENQLCLIAIIDEEISVNLFGVTLHSDAAMESICQSIRRALHPSTHLIEYVLSGTLVFAHNRMHKYFYSLLASKQEERGACLFSCLKDAIKMLRTIQKFGKDLSHIAHTPPHLFKKIRSFFSASCDYLEEQILPKSTTHAQYFKDWPTKNFDSIPLTPSQMAIRWIGFFNQLVLDKLFSDAVYEEKSGAAILKLLKDLSPEVRSIFLKESMPKFMRSIQPIGGYPIELIPILLHPSGSFEMYTDVALFWTELQNSPLSLHLLVDKGLNAEAIDTTKQVLKEKVLTALDPNHSS